MRRQQHGEAVWRKSGPGGKALLEGGVLEREKVMVGGSVQNGFCFRLLP